MGEPFVDGQDAGDSSARPKDRNVSVMRKYLESGIDFEWPESVGERQGNHCTLHGNHIPLIWKRRLSDKKASIDIYIGGDQYAFKEAFAVKTIREKTYLKSKTKARNEVENMRDLRYPHIAALLGTFTYLDRLSILIFPAAPCDLHVFLKSISKEMADLRRGRTQLQEFAREQSRADTPDSRSSTSSFRDRPGSPRSSQPFSVSHGQGHDQEFWPLKSSLPAKIDHLRCYFVCLSQALRYIHESGVRHKDIKPENILIDASGSVVLTDFGISRRFPKKVPHVTNDKWEWTRKYASPEIMKGKKVPRADPSDVFSLGCVFLEMATLILGRDLDRLLHHYATTVNDSGHEDAYHCNLDKVYSWIEVLKKPRDAECKPVHDPARSVPDLANAGISGQDFMPDQNSKMIQSLDTLRLMLDLEPQERPLAKDLWENFKDVSTQTCRDCDPRHPERWTPTPRQKTAVESGTRRRSMQLIPEEVSDNPSMESRDGQPEDGNLLSANYRSDRSSLMARRSSSPHTGRKSQYSQVLLNPSFTQSPPPILSSPEPIIASTQAEEKAATIKKPTESRTGRRATTTGNTRTTSRSTSPRKRRPLSESRVRAGGTQSPRNSVPPIPQKPIKRENISSPPPAPTPDSVPAAAKNALSPTQSLSLNKPPAKQNIQDIEEKQAANGSSNHLHTTTDALSPATQIIIYDLADKMAYVGAYAQLKDKVYKKDYISQPLPRSSMHVEIGEKGSPIAYVDLSPLGPWTRLRRWMGEFPTLYVLNFSAQPLG